MDLRPSRRPVTPERGAAGSATACQYAAGAPSPARGASAAAHCGRWRTAAPTLRRWRQPPWPTGARAVQAAAGWRAARSRLRCAESPAASEPAHLIAAAGHRLSALRPQSSRASPRCALFRQHARSGGGTRSKWRSREDTSKRCGWKPEVGSARLRVPDVRDRRAFWALQATTCCGSLCRRSGIGPGGHCPATSPEAACPFVLAPPLAPS